MAFESRGLSYLHEPARPFRFEAPANTRALIYAGCSLGAYSYINGGTVRERTHIGRFCSIADGVALGVGDHAVHLVSNHPFATHAAFDPKHESPYRAGSLRPFDTPTLIGHDVWIGTNAIVRLGVQIGIGAVVGAGAVVTKDVPPYAIVAGVPARISRYRFPEPVRDALLAAEWWEYPLETLQKFPTNNIAAFLDLLAASGATRAAHQWVEF
jgi:virginiamycin A acetyltransferase